jgi:hypothetical protein
MFGQQCLLTCDVETMTFMKKKQNPSNRDKTFKIFISQERIRHEIHTEVATIQNLLRVLEGHDC